MWKFLCKANVVEFFGFFYLAHLCENGTLYANLKLLPFCISAHTKLEKYI